MKKVINIFSYILLLIVFTATTIISFLDLVQVLDVKAIFGLDLNVSLLKINILIVSLIGSILIVDRWFLNSDVKVKLDEMHSLSTQSNEELRVIDDILKKIESSKQSTRVFNNRKDSYIELNNIIRDVPSGTNICVTHFEKYRGAPYDIGQIEQEKEFMELWQERVTNKDLMVRMIVHVCSTFDLKEVEDRVNSFADNPNFCLNVMYGPPIRPYLDFMVIRNSSVFFDFSSDPISPFEAAVGFKVQDPEMTRIIEKYFDIWWSRFSIPIKDKNGILKKNLIDLQDILPERTAEASLDQAFDLGIRFAKEKELYNIFSDVLIDYTKIGKIPVSDIYKKQVFNYLVEARRKINNLLSQHIELSPDDGSLVLVRIFEEANKSIEAVSYDPNHNHQTFWDSALGRRILRANAKAIRENISISRFFIVEKDEVNTDELKNVISSHKSAGVEVFIVFKNEVDTSLIKDFLVQDEMLTFHLEEITDNNFLKKSWLSIDENQVLEDILKIKSLRYKAYTYEDIFQIE
jgi:hypothetical protein